MSFFCPMINGKIPLKSNFTMYFGVEPAHLTATISADSPPSGVTYGGANVSLDMDVVSWTKTDEGIYTIQAADDPYTWKNKRINVSYNDPIDGVEVSVLADAITSATGWSVNLLNSEKVPYVIFSGSVVEAIKLLERMTGGIAYLDHMAKTINFTNVIPTVQGGGTVIEEAYAQPAGDVVCYGTLLKLPQDNLDAANGAGLLEWKTLSMTVPAEAWEITSATPLGVQDIEVGSSKYRKYEVIDYSGNQVQYTQDVEEAIMQRCVSLVFVATTIALRQDEVLLRPDGELDGGVKFGNPYGSEANDPYTGEPGKAIYKINVGERVSFVPPSNVQNKVNEIMEKLTNPQDGLEYSGIFVIITPNIAGDKDSLVTTSDYFFGFRAIVVGKVLIPFLQYRIIKKKEKVGGTSQTLVPDSDATGEPIEKTGGLLDYSVEGPTNLPDAPNLNMAFVSLYIRERILRNLHFDLLLDGYRIKFPYFASSTGEMGIAPDLSDNAMYIQNNEASSLKAASDYAKAMSDLINKNGYVAVLDGSPNGASKYIEDFSGKFFRAIAYYRKA